MQSNVSGYVIVWIDPRRRNVLRTKIRRKIKYRTNGGFLDLHADESDLGQFPFMIM